MHTDTSEYLPVYIRTLTQIHIQTRLTNIRTRRADIRMRRADLSVLLGTHIGLSGKQQDNRGSVKVRTTGNSR